MQHHQLQEIDRQAITLRDLADLLKRNLILIVLSALAGLLCAMAYVFVTPNMYEATWKMRMAQYSTSTIEDPASLVSRLHIPTAYSVTVLQRCIYADKSGFGEYVDGLINAQVSKNISMAVDFSYRAINRSKAKECADAIVEMIIQQQQELINEQLSGRDEQLSQFKQALKIEQNELEQLKRKESGNFAYLVNLDKLSWLRTRIVQLQEENLLAQKRPAKLIAPIYISSNPVTPKARMLLPLGAMFGLTIGLLFILVREWWKKPSTEK